MPHLNNLPRREREVGVMQISPGSRSVLARFEKAVREYERAFAHAPFDCQDEKDSYVFAKRAMIRRLRRLEGSLPSDRRGKRLQRQAPTS